MIHSGRSAEDQIRLLAVIQRKAPLYFPDLKTEVEARIVEKRSRAYSDIYRVVVTNGRGSPHYVLVKRFPEAESQFQAMNKVWARFAAHPTWKIPRPLDYLPQDSALVIEEVFATPLLKRLPWFFWDARACEIAEFDCHRAGQWLRFYHDAGRADEWAPLNAEGHWPGLDETLEELAKSGFEKTICPILNAWFVPLVKRVVTERRPFSSVHGDFTMDNVMVNQEFVVVLDLTAEARNAIDLDVAAFLNSILMLRLTRPVPSAAMDRMRKAFLTGYFGTDEYVPIVIYFLQGLGLADIALEIVQRRRSSLAHVWVERMIGAALAKVITDLRRLL